MRRLLTSLAMGGAGVLVAAPASAQYYSQPNPYSYGYGYNSQFGQVQELQSRISNVFRSLGSVRPDQRYQISGEAIALNRDLRIAAAGGVNPYELRNLEIRLARLERRERWASMSGWNGYNGYSRYNGYNGNDSYGFDQGYRYQRDDRDDDDD